MKTRFTQSDVPDYFGRESSIDEFKARIAWEWVCGFVRMCTAATRPVTMSAYSDIAYKCDMICAHMHFRSAKMYSVYVQDKETES